MANPEHHHHVIEGAAVWNRWRANLPATKRPNLRGSSLKGQDLRGFALQSVNLAQSNLTDANLEQVDLTGSDLTGANLTDAKVRKADLTGANLTGANLTRTDLAEADLTRANLTRAHLVQTDLTAATIDGCRIYGISAWDLGLARARQSDLIITPEAEPEITVDNVEVAQFVYLLLANPKIRDVIDTIGKKAVLILGRFTPERKAILDAVKGQLRLKNYVPILFDFTGPVTRDLIETVSTLAHLARFVVADITDPRSIPQELQAIVPHLPSLPVQPLLRSGEAEYGVFEHFEDYPWVLPVFRYKDADSLLSQMEEKVISPAEARASKPRR